ncbi:hypothetical protein BDY24DRAFT_418600 [Mrakia frigida]|uniref:nucleotidyltransferase domain-containing protein n=1 Tax=Mrakia frigida TaxID=29902 RepID=UPI003FCC240C
MIKKASSVKSMSKSSSKPSKAPLSFLSRTKGSKKTVVATKQAQGSVKPTPSKLKKVAKLAKINLDSSSSLPQRPVSKVTSSSLPPPPAKAPALNWLELYAAKKKAMPSTSQSLPLPPSASISKPTPSPSTSTSSTSTSSPAASFFPSSSKPSNPPVVTTPVAEAQPLSVPKSTFTPSPPPKRSKPSDVPLDPRGTVPPSVLEAGNELHKEILKSWIASQPSPLRIAKRNNLLAELSHLVSGLGPQYTVVPFGSVAVGADGETSDLDLAIRDGDHPAGFDDPKLFVQRQAPYDMHKLAVKLARSMKEVQAIPWAKVPVVKFVDPISGIDVDINCNNLGGVNNSTWLLSYFQISPHTLRPLIHAVKKWASTRNINDPSGQQGGTSFSSYTIQLLCLAYLQAPIHQLPSSTPSTNLHSLLPNLQSPSLLTRLKTPTTHLHLRDKPPRIIKINTTYAPLSSLPPSEIDLWTDRNQNVDVGELVKGFFKFYAGETGEEWRGNRFSWKEGAVSPLEGGFARRLEEGMEGVEKVQGSGFGGVWIRKIGSEVEKGGLDWCLAEEGKGREGGQESQQLAKWVHADLVVRDPFEWHKNCTQQITQETSRRIRDEFARAHTILSTNPKASFLRDVCAPLSEAEFGSTSKERNVWG